MDLEAKIALVEGKVTELSTALKDERLALKQETAKLTDATTKIASLELKLTEKTTEVEKANVELVTLREFKTKTEETTLSARVDEAFDTYKDKKGLTDSSKKSMLIVLKADAEQFEKDYPKVKASERHLMRTLVNTESRDQKNLPRTHDDGAPVVQMSEHDLANAAIALAAEKGITLEAAQDLVLSGISR